MSLRASLKSASWRRQSRVYHTKDGIVRLRRICRRHDFVRLLTVRNDRKNMIKFLNKKIISFIILFFVFILILIVATSKIWIGYNDEVKNCSYLLDLSCKRINNDGSIERIAWCDSYWPDTFDEKCISNNIYINRRANLLKEFNNSTYKIIIIYDIYLMPKEPIVVFERDEIITNGTLQIQPFFIIKLYHVIIASILALIFFLIGKFSKISAFKYLSILLLLLGILPSWLVLLILLIMFWVKKKEIKEFIKMYKLRKQKINKN